MIWTLDDAAIQMVQKLCDTGGHMSNFECQMTFVPPHIYLKVLRNVVL